MAFDTTTRNKLQRMVGECRRLLADEFDEQLQGLYGIYAQEGRVLELEKLTSLDDDHHQTATLLRDRINHLTSGMASEKQPLAEAVRRVLREQAFTVLNRFAALRMAEERGFIQECVGQGLKSKGFQVFETVARSGLGGAYERYVTFIHGMFDELSLDLGVLFDRWSPFGLLFPREPALLKFFELLNDPELKPLWREDETIGWVYQYYNDEAERKQMRKESSAPRDSRELAVRNQFFTPRYVVEFLTDNTLGRLWYEMTQGRTRLKDQCRYLVRRPDEVFFGHMTEAAQGFPAPGVIELAKQLQQGDATSFARFTTDDPSVQRMIDMAHAVTGYARHPANEQTWQWVAGVRRDVFLPAAYSRATTQDILDALFLECRADRHGGDGSIYTERWFVDACNEVRRRALCSREANLPQEDLLKQPVFIPHRPLKDPREIRLLDPACGSMHFGLYAFDLFTVIYDEAWEIAHGPDDAAKSAETFAPFVAFAATFPDKAAFLREVPRLIIERNIHGIDIDPRAAQIAGLSLWLRAQRAWNQAGVKPANRPRITRSNLVCAEPMPGEKELLREFVEQQFVAGERSAFAFLLEKIFDCMTLASEAGSLLRIEEEIRTAIADAKRLWKQGPKVEQAMMFAEPGEKAGQGEMRLDLSGITDEQFWERAEQRIYDALEAYAEQAENGGGFQRRLFADDAAQGFAFIDLCRKRYDVALMNPPFGSPAESFEGKEAYPNSGRDIYAMFVERMGAMRTAGGRIGAILPRTGLFIGTMIDLRAQCYLASTPLELLVDLGKDVLDGATIRTACYVIGAKQESVTCVRIGNIAERETRVAEILRAIECGRPNEDLFIRKFSFFEKLPGSAIAYWIPERLALRLPSLDKLEQLADIRQGIATGDNFRFLRLLTELPSERSEFCFYSKGGEPVPFISDETLYVHAAHGCAEMKANAAQEYGSASRTIKNEDTFRLPGITYSQVNDACLKFRVHPPDAIYDMKGPVLFPREGVDDKALLAFLNSSAVEDFMRMMTDGRQWHVSALKNVPVPKFDQVGLSRLAELSERATRLRLAYYNSDETGHYYSISRNGEFSVPEHEAVEGIADEIDAAVWATFGATTEEVASFSRQGVLFLERTISTETAPAPTRADVIHLAVGTVFGRWDIRYATGERPAPELPDPFAPLPVCPPGMLQGDDGLPLSPEAGRRLRAEGRYPLDVVWDGILVDDPEHPLDLERRVHAALAVLWSDRADALEHEACALLGVPTLREWFRRPAGFFADHLKRYSKSRRQAPIYWPLSTASGSYTLWLYYHRLNDQTLYTCVNDFVKPKLEQVNRDLERQNAECRMQNGGTAKQREQVEALGDFAIELKELHDELLRVAGLPYKPNLNDGVLITASPLWKLFRLPKWQKELKACWEALEAGEYEWAHLAYPLWPDRVRKVCKADRSIAIAHGLEDLCDLKAPEKKAKRGKKQAEQMELEKENS